MSTSNVTLSRTRALALLVLTNVFWGSSHAVAKVTLETFPPPLLAALRFTLVSLVLGAIWGWARRNGPAERVSRPDMLKLLGLGLLSVVAAYLLAYWGISLTTATDASLMIIGEVIFTALLALLLTGERLGRWRGLGIALGCAGVVVIVLNGAEAGAAGGGLGRVLGNVLLLIALFSQALYTVVGSGLARRYQPMTVITIIYCGSMLVWLPLLLWYGLSGQFPAASLAAWAGVVYLALFPTIIGMLIWLAVLRTVGANVGAISLFVQPLVGMFLGIVVLGDALTPGLALGAVLIFAAIGLTTVQVEAAQA